MTVTAKAFTKFPLSLMNKEADLNSDTIKCALFTSSLAPAQTTSQYFDAAPFNANQVATANGYSAGGATLSTPTIGASSLTTTFDAVDPSWTVTGAGFTYRIAVFYDDSPSSNKPLISYVDFGADVTAVAGTHSIVLDSAGIARAVCS